MRHGADLTYTLIELVQSESSPSTSTNSSATSIPGTGRRSTRSVRRRIKRSIRWWLPSPGWCGASRAGPLCPGVHCAQSVEIRKTQWTAITALVRTGIHLTHVSAHAASCAHQRHTSARSRVEAVLGRGSGREEEYMQDYKKRLAKINGHWDDYALNIFSRRSFAVCGVSSE